MNPHLDLDSLLPLDAAPQALIDDTMRIRSHAHLEQILTMPVPTASPRRRPVAHPLRALRWAAIPVAAVGALAAAIMLPGGVGVPPAQASLATWQAEPSPLGDEATAAANVACRAAIDQALAAEEPTIPARPALGDGPVLADSRGDWGTLAYVGGAAPDSDFTSCLVWFNEADNPTVATVDTTVAGAGIGGYRVDDLVVGGVGLTRPAETISYGPIPNEAGPVDAETGVAYLPLQPTELQLVQASQAQLVGGDEFAAVYGRVGSDVQGIVIHTVTGGDVEASVVNGWFTAWWPGLLGGDPLIPCITRVNVEGGASWFGCDTATSVTVTRSDGSTVEIPFEISAVREAQGLLTVGTDQ